MGYQWQGEPVKVKFGYCKVSLNKEKSLFWYNYECSIGRNRVSNTAVVEAVRIESGKDLFCIANHFGIGVHKLKNGGWPNYSHFSLENCEFKQSGHAAFNLRSFDLEGYSEHEANREKWQKENFPEEYEKIKSLRNLALKINPSR